MTGMTDLQDMYYFDGSSGIRTGKTFFDSSPIVMIKSPFDLINGIAVKKKMKKENQSQRGLRR